MSNKVVSATYRSIIDDVIANVRQDFEEMGIEREVLEELQRSWEARLVATGVTDFEGAPQLPNAGGSSSSAGGPSGSASSPKKQEEEDEKKPVKVKEEAKDDVDLGGGEAGPSQSNGKSRRIDGTSDATARTDRHDGAHDDDDDETARVGEKRKQPPSNSDEIGSDLDDSEEEADGEGAGEGMDGDTVLCLYDKVQRVRNRWKCVLKDGVANIGGKDYLFSRCNTEFEW